MSGWPWSADGEVVEIAVFGMACRHCAGTVETALEDVDGVREADADRESGTARVTVVDGVSREALFAAVRSVGYEARLP